MIAGFNSFISSLLYATSRVILGSVLRPLVLPCAICGLEDEVGFSSLSFWMTVNGGVHPAMGQDSLSEGSGRKCGI